jgi:hypothetical protein
MASKIVNIATAAFLAFAFILIFSNAMKKSLSRDENMYCSAGALMSQGKTVYKDFSHVSQLPYHPLLLSIIYGVSGSTYYLLIARIVSCIADFSTVFFIILIYKKVFSGFLLSGFFLGLAAATLLLFNPAFNYISGLAWNHNIVICLAAASFWLYIFFNTSNRKTTYIKTALIAALLSLAACMRITTVLIEILFFIIICLRKYNSRKERIVSIVIFVCSSIIIFAWPAWTILQAPKAFWINLFVIPPLNSRLLSEMRMVFSKYDMTVFYLMMAEYLFPILIAIYLYICMLRRLTLKKIGSITYLGVLLPVIFFIIIYIPPTIWRQYFAPPVPFLLISLVFPLYFFRQNSQSPHFKIASSLLAACVFISIGQQIILLNHVKDFSKPQTWRPVQLHNLCQSIALSIDKKGPVLTISPIYALEGGRQIYPQLSAGLFVYRIADNLTDEQRRLTNTVGPNSLKILTVDPPPAAIIVGTEKGSGFDTVENTLLEVTDPYWRRQRFDNLNVYTRP